MALRGKLVPVDTLTADDMARMLQLMQTFYDGMTSAAFYKDLRDKDTCILLWDENDAIQGFSSQKMLTLELPEGPVRGVFSGDTIIHPDHWGSLELHKLFARNFFRYAGEYGEFYWFLISKGYKTYRFLPTFFNRFYPSYAEPVPEREASIMAALGARLYPDDYNPVSGVVEYRRVKDRLRAGFADITPSHERDKHVAYFLKRNPGYARGNDLVCLALLRKDNLRARTLTMLFGKDQQ